MQADFFAEHHRRGDGFDDLGDGEDCEHGQHQRADALTVGEAEEEGQADADDGSDGGDE